MAREVRMRRRDIVGRRNCGEDAVRVETFKYVTATLRNTVPLVVLTCLFIPYTSPTPAPISKSGNTSSPTTLYPV